MANEKLELLKNIGINTGLIADFLKILEVNNPDTDTLMQLLKLYQENEEYRNQLEAIMNKEHTALTWEFIEYKQRHETEGL